MAGKPPYLPFYVKDFAADAKVEAMTTEQVGAYILLLCKAWQEEPPGSIPADDAVLARWARLDPSRWAGIKLGVLAPFALGSDNRYHQKRLRQEYEKFVKVSKARASAAKSRWGDANAEQLHDANALQMQCKSDAKVMQVLGSGSESESGSSSGGGIGVVGERGPPTEVYAMPPKIENPALWKEACWLANVFCFHQFKGDTGRWVDKPEDIAPGCYELLRLGRTNEKDFEARVKNTTRDRSEKFGQFKFREFDRPASEQDQAKRRQGGANERSAARFDPNRRYPT